MLRWAALSASQREGSALVGFVRIRLRALSSCQPLLSCNYAFSTLLPFITFNSNFVLVSRRVSRMVPIRTVAATLQVHANSTLHCSNE